MKKGMFDVLTSKDGAEVLKKNDVRKRRKELSLNHAATIQEMEAELDNLRDSFHEKLEEMILSKRKGTGRQGEDVKAFRGIGKLEAQIEAMRNAIQRVKGLEKKIFEEAPDEYIALFED